MFFDVFRLKPDIDLAICSMLFMLQGAMFLEDVRLVLILRISLVKFATLHQPTSHVGSCGFRFRVMMILLASMMYGYKLYIISKTHKLSQLSHIYIYSRLYFLMVE